MLHLDLKLNPKIEKQFVELINKQFNGSYEKFIESVLQKTRNYLNYINLIKLIYLKIWELKIWHITTTIIFMEPINENRSIYRR